MRFVYRAWFGEMLISLDLCDAGGAAADPFLWTIPVAASHGDDEGREDRNNQSAGAGAGCGGSSCGGGGCGSGG